MPGIGSLIVDLQLQIAKFVSNSAEVHKTLKGMEKGFADFKSRALGSLKGVAASLAAGFAVGAVANTIKQQIDLADRLDEIAQSAGLTASQLSEYAVIAKMAGLETDEFAKGARKLADDMAKAAAGNKDAKELFAAFAIDPGTVGNIKSVDDALLEFADRFKNITDPTLAVAAATEVFGAKLGGKLLPLLQQGSSRILELREVTRLFGATVGEDFARASSRINDSLDLLGAASEGFKRRFVSAIAGPLAAAAEAFVEMKKEAARTQQALGGFNADPITDFATDVIRALTFVIDQFVAVKRAVEIATIGIAAGVRSAGQFASGAAETVSSGKLFEGIGAGDITNPVGAVAKLWVNVFKGGAEKAKPAIKQALQDITDIRELEGPGAAYRRIFDELREESTRANATPPKDKETDSSLEARLAKLLKKETAKTVDNSEIKKQLDGLLQEIARDLGEINKLSQERLGFLQLAFQEAFIGINEFYERKRNVQEESTRASVEAIDREIAALQKFATTSTLKPEERIEAENKIAAAQQKRADVERQAAVDSQRNWFDQRKALEDYRRAVADITVQILELEGKTEEAARRRFQLQNEDLRKRVTANEGPDSETLKSIQRLEEQAVSRAQLNKLSEDAGIIQDQLRNKEELFEVARKRGTIGELALLRESDEARRNTVVRLREIADEQLRVAESGKDERAIQNARNFAVEVEKLAASADQLRDKFDQIAESAFSDFISNAVTGTKSLKDAFKDMVNSIVQQISRLAAQDIAGSLFGKQSAGGGFGGFFAKLFGGGSSTPQPGSGGFVGPLPAGGASNIVQGEWDWLDEMMKRGGGFGGSVVSSIGDWIGKLFRAEGGPVAAGQPYIVGERGPELIVPRAAGMVMPAGSFGGGVTMHFAISGPVGRETQQQIGRAAYEGIMRAQRRNG